MSIVPKEAWGHLSVLNCGAGDLEFKFDKDDPQETARAKRVIEDMLRRGYSLFVQVGKKLVPVEAFDAKKECYIIADGPLYAGDPPPQATEGKEVIATKRGRKGVKREVPMKSAKATGVAPTAGG